MMVICRECGNASESAIHWRCPNPACYPGMKADGAATSAWEKARDAFVAEHSNKRAYSINPQAYREMFESMNPRPKRTAVSTAQEPMSLAEWRMHKGS